jgi:hypothetical protein
MFHAKPVIVFMALLFLCNQVPAQSQQFSGLKTSAMVTESELFEPLNSFRSSSIVESVIAPAAERTISSTTRRMESGNYPDKLSVHPFSKIALGFKVDTLGAGVEVATPLSRRFNLRSTANLFNFRYLFNIDGIDYDTELHFHSGQLNVDWFPFHGEFHVSPGVLYFNNNLYGKASVPPGQPFQLSNTSYINSVDDPVYGTTKITYARKIAPALTVGFGNILSRTGRHFTVPFEVGVAYLGSAKMDVQLAGTTCTNAGCFNAATDLDTQASLHDEVKSLNGELTKYKLYPIISLGFAYRF